MRSKVVKELVGQANTILISAEGPGVVTTISVSALKPRSPNRLKFSGVVKLDESVKLHIEEVVLACVDEILNNLKLEQNNYELSVKNIGAASSSDLSFTIGGFSADVPIFLSLLSASLKLAIAQDIAFTGHISSKAGDILPVSSLDKKTATVLLKKNISKFVFPVLDADGSMSSLKPNEYQAALAAIRSARGRVKLVEVRDTSELISQVFSIEALVQSALFNDYFETEISESSVERSNPEAVYLTNDNL
ncbi:MAG: hypothetical protein MUP82_10635, partial [Candidatus Marinimicrobia bacterium]|nr:hypothetical protein [Candidatus Neomarinimicrobiota bacterium]